MLTQRFNRRSRSTTTDDGVSERWLHQLTSNPAPGVFQVLDRLASGDWDVARLDHYLEQPFWRLGGDDDRSVAYLVRPHGVQSTRVGPIGDTV